MTKKRTLDQLNKLPTTLNHSVVFQGKLQGMDNFIVHGEVIGDSDVQGTIMLGPDSHWKGNVTADVVVIRGAVEGNVTARVKLEVRDTGRVAGDVFGPLITIAEGAKIKGRLPLDSHVTRFVERRNR